MAVERGIKAKLRYRWDEFLSVGYTLNPVGAARTTPFVPKPKDRLVVLAEDDG